MAAGLNTFARFDGIIHSPHQPADLAIHVGADDFTLPRGGVLLGFALQAGDSSALDPGGIRISSQPNGSAKAFAHKNDGDSFALGRLGAGDFNVGLLGEHGSVGAWQLDVFLAGDVNADFQVDQRDLDAIQSLRGKRLGDTSYSIDADVNRNGQIGGRDMHLAERNFGAATSVRPLRVTLSLAPASDPDGNDVVLRPDVTVTGQTLPGTAIRLAQGSDSSTTVSTISDSHGAYHFDLSLPHGINLLHADATDAFGQHAVADRTVRYGDVILDWNAALLTTVRDFTFLSNDPYPHRVVNLAPPEVARELAMMHVAMYDAVNAVEGGYAPFHADIAAAADAAPEAAAAAAAHRVLRSLYSDPDDTALFDAALAEALGVVPDGPGKTDGIALGDAVANEILAWRANDGAHTLAPSSPAPVPGTWRRTPPDFLPPLLPQWPGVQPFAMTSDSQFRPPPPPELDSVAYAAAVNEVKEFGSLNSVVRTPDETQLALFWADGAGTFTPPGHWNQIASEVSLTRGLTLAENARLFALLDISLADAGIACWDAKYQYGVWRPITAIREADTDGNDGTTSDTSWTPLLKTPPFPTYTSGHSTFSGAADAVLSYLFGNNVAFTSQSDGHSGFRERPLERVITRSFDSFHAAADEAGQSRVYGGIHFQFDNTNGLAAGRALGNYVVQNFLRAD